MMTNNYNKKRKRLLYIAIGLAVIYVVVLAGSDYSYSSDCHAVTSIQNSLKMKNVMENQEKMKVEIWSDIMCPFCYIGKRKFEMALANFPKKDKIEVVWKSYQLMPDLKTQPGKNIHTFLSETKGMSIETAKMMNSQVTEIGEKIGLNYDFDNSIAANTFNAHQLIQYAKSQNKGERAEERLFKAYFTEGKNIDDLKTLVTLGVEIGLDASALKIALETGKYADQVRADIDEGQKIGVRGVPFFVFDRKNAVSGAQEPQAFLERLSKTYEEWNKNNPEPTLEILNGQSCSPDEECK